MKLLFLDLDNTLLNQKKQVTPENKQALDEARAKGHKIILCSGRPLSAMGRLIEELDMNQPGCLVASYNGGMITDTYAGKTLYSEHLTKDEVRLLFSKADQYGQHVHTYDSRGLMARTFNREVEFYVKASEIPYRIVPGLPDSGLTEDPVKVLMVNLDDKEPLLRMQKDILAQTDDLDSFFSCPQFVEFVRRGVNKGSAVRRLADLLQVPIENTVAVGDAENDLPMIREAGIGVAMANAIPEAKAVANYITEHDCEHSGVAEVVQKFILS